MLSVGTRSPEGKQSRPFHKVSRISPEESASVSRLVQRPFLSKCISARWRAISGESSRWRIFKGCRGACGRGGAPLKIVTGHGGCPFDGVASSAPRAFPVGRHSCGKRASLSLCDALSLALTLLHLPLASPLCGTAHFPCSS